MFKRNNRERSHGEKPFRNFLYTVYSLLNAVAFTVFFYNLYQVERSLIDVGTMIVCGAVAVLGIVVGILRPLFSK